MTIFQTSLDQPVNLGFVPTPVPEQNAWEYVEAY